MYSRLIDELLGKSDILAEVTVTVIEVTAVALEKLMVLSGPSNAYEVPVANVCVRVMVPKMIPLPVRVEVMVILFEPVSILPVVMFTVAAVISFDNVTVMVDVDLLMLRILNVVTPVIAALVVPVNCIVLVAGVKVPLFTQLCNRVCV